MHTYLTLANIQKSSLTAEHVNALLELANKDSRVKQIKIDEEAATPSFFIDAIELDCGVYSLGAIANHLNKLPSQIRKQMEDEELPDNINITSFMDYGNRDESDIRHMPKFTREKLSELLETLEPSTTRAQCINILSYKLYGNESIADRILRDHFSHAHARRHAQLFVLAGCANELNKRKNHFGTIIFEDGSSL